MNRRSWMMISAKLSYSRAFALLAGNKQWIDDSKGAGLNGTAA